jgi:PAS domain S-box-containing protein
VVVSGMATSGWLRKWKGARSARDHASALVRAAAGGDSLDLLLNLGVQALLAAANADRAGLWLAGDRQGESGRGRVMERVPGPIPEQWKHLDISMPFLRAALESPVPLHAEIGPHEAMLPLGPLVGMRTAIWIPLRTRNQTFGLAMVAHARNGARVDLEVLRARGDEIALAVRHQRDSRQLELASEEIRAQSRLSRAILCGVSADFIIPQIALTARHHLRAEFIAVGRGNEPPVSGEGCDGPDEWAAAIRQGPLLQLWRKAYETGQPCEMHGKEIPARPDSLLESSPTIVERVVAIPIEVRNRAGGVLLAGLANSEGSSGDLSRLEPYALLGASALDQEIGRAERTSFKRLLRKMTEDSGESLAVIDAGGVVRETSPAGAALIFPQRRRREETQFEDLFSPEARGAIAEWRKRLASVSSGEESRQEQAGVVLEAALEQGGVVRLRLRTEMEGQAGDPPRWLIAVEDRDARLAEREALTRLETEMAGLLGSIESGVLLLDEAGNIRMASDRLGAIVGIEARRLMEMGNIETMIDQVAGHFSRPAETAARWREHVRRGEESSWEEFELTRPSRRIVERFARPLHKPDGTRLGWLEVYRDITGQRLIQSKLLQTEKMAALGQLVSGIAHELNNPLTSIQGYAQILLGRRGASERAADVRKISQQAERATRIVKNLLLFSRETKPERRAVNLNEVVERTLSLRSYELKLENIEVELALDPGLPNTLADGAQLQQVVLNLMVNAEQAIAQERGEEPRQGHIQFRTRRLPGDRIAMEVSDDGPGIPPEAVPRVFDPFFTTKPAGVGTGLGLSIVYGIVQEHGGEVTAESHPGQGAILTVELPALPVTGFEFAAAGETTAAPHTARIFPMAPPRPATRAERILVVEDEPTVAQLIADVMTEEGHAVDTLLDSREALARLEDSSYGLVICDLKMPHLDGPGIYRTLVQRGNPAQHRILFVTGDTMSPRTTEFLKSSGVPYLAKPFLVEELNEAVRQALAAVPASEEAAARQDWPRAIAREQ